MKGSNRLSSTHFCEDYKYSQARISFKNDRAWREKVELTLNSTHEHSCHNHYNGFDSRSFLGTPMRII